MNIGKGLLARRIAAAAGALALGFGGLAGAALSANATPTGLGNIDPTAQASLTINKFDGAQGDAGDGTKKDNTSSLGKPLAGVVFKIQRVAQKDGTAIDLNTPAGWDTVKKVTTDNVSTDYSLDAGVSVTTAADGTVSQPLDHGLYYVTETDASNATEGGKPVTVVSQTAPFLVTLPLPQVASDGSEDGSWLYDVNVYPKNQLLTAPVKTINSDADQSASHQLTVGDTVTYTITQTVPQLNKEENGKYTSATIYDTLPTGLLAYDSDVSLTNSGTAFDKNDYKQEGDTEWTLTASGLDKIRQGDVITIVFKARVLAVTETGDIQNPGSGDIKNPGYGSEFNGHYVPGTPTPFTYWGYLKVTKVDEGEHKLAGASFSIFERNGDDPCPPSAPASGAVASGTSDSTGEVQWEGVTPASPLGLFVANSSDGELPNPSKDYCLYETKAPAGYMLGHGQYITIRPGDSVTPHLVYFMDEQQGHPNLPLTGATGAVVMTLGGIALVAAGGVAYVISRRRSAR